jgi:hypothetical protein
MLHQYFNHFLHLLKNILHFYLNYSIFIQYFIYLFILNHKDPIYFLRRLLYFFNFDYCGINQSINQDYQSFFHLLFKYKILVRSNTINVTIASFK